MTVTGEELFIATVLGERIRLGVFISHSHHINLENNRLPAPKARYALALTFIHAIAIYMSNKRIRLHIERSLLLLNHLKENTGLGKAAIAETIRREVYGSLHLLSAAPKPETVSAYFAGKRPIPFDPLGAKIPSWLMAVEMCFPGSSRYFFHPLPNLLAGPIESSEKSRARLRKIPNDWIELAQRLGNVEEAKKYAAINKSLNSRERSRGKPTPSDPLDWVRTNMYALLPDVRNILLTRSGLARGWRRKFDPVEHEVTQLKAVGGLEALAAAVAIHQEANLIGDSHRSEKSRALVIELMPCLDEEKTLRRVSKAFQREITHFLGYSSFARYDPELICVQTLPLSLQGVALTLIRMQRFTTS